MNIQLNKFWPSECFKHVATVLIDNVLYMFS